MRLADFRYIVVADFEYIPSPGSVKPVCCCARELRSGCEYRVWEDELGQVPPYPHGPDALFIAYHAPAELSAYISLGWEMPRHILDLCIEFRLAVNGVIDKNRPRKLEAALRHYGLPEVVDKENWQKRILAGPPFSSDDKAGILGYCAGDVRAEVDVLRKLAPQLPADLRQVLMRGRYCLAVADMEHRGVPVDQETWDRILEDREVIQQTVAAWANRTLYPLYDGTSFRLEAFGQWLKELGLAGRWRRLRRTDRLDIKDKTFKKFAWHPQIEQLRQVRQVIQQLRKPSFTAVNGRNYYSILPFRAETSRNSTLRCIFTAPAWVRGLIMPPDPDTALVYCDYEQEEFLIGGVLAGDRAVIESYQSGDPYLSFAQRAGLVPAGGTKESHPAERALAKQLTLATSYGMSAWGLADRLGVTQKRAAQLLAAHRQVFHRFWAWSDETVRMARWTRKLETRYGWRLAVTKKTGENTLRNWRVQTAGAEVLRIANVLLWERGIETCAPVHDAFLLQSRRLDLEDVVKEVRRCLEKASEYVLDGHIIRTEMRILRNSDRLSEPRGQVIWDLVQTIKERLRAAA